MHWQAHSLLEQFRCSEDSEELASAGGVLLPGVRSATAATALSWSMGRGGKMWKACLLDFI